MSVCKEVDIHTSSHLEVIGIRPPCLLRHFMSGYGEIFHWLGEMDTAWWPQLKEEEVNLILNSCSDKHVKKSTRPRCRSLDKTFVYVAWTVRVRHIELVLENEILKFADDSNSSLQDLSCLLKMFHLFYEGRYLMCVNLMLIFTLIFCH